ncbi:heme oxygenase [Entomortierella chlamydospora]|nr:heme oxygenase [Entomortierella chlamydospora]
MTSNAKETPLLLTDELRLKTKGLHSKMDRLVQLGLFAVLDYKVYRQILLGFYYVFKTFEEEYQLQLQKSPVNMSLLSAHSPELRRTEAFEADLAYFYGPQWKEQVKPTEHVQAYMDHIRDIAKNKPEKLIAFPATLYLGIFFGGQIVRSKIVKAINFFPSPPEKKMGGESDNCIAIFTFRERDPSTGHASGKRLDPNNAKNMLKARLNNIPGINDQTADSIAAREAIAEEAKEIFVRNLDLITSAEGVWSVWVRWIFTFVLYAAVAFGIYQYVVLQFNGGNSANKEHEL